MKGLKDLIIMKDKIFDKYYDKIYYWALGKTKNKEDSKDLTNDIFVEIFIFLDKKIKVKKLDNLIWTIAFNTWKNKVRKKTKDKVLIYDEDISNNIKYEEYNIDKIIYKEILENLKNYKLTDKELTCFNLYYKNDLSIKEISRVLQTDISNVKYYLFNSRKKIRKCYHD